MAPKKEKTVEVVEERDEKEELLRIISDLPDDKLVELADTFVKGAEKDNEKSKLEQGYSWD